MESYFIAKNNLRRSLKHKSRFLVAFLLPILLCLLAGLLNIESSIKLHIGVVENEHVLEELQKIEGIKAELADKHTYHTDLIMGKYQLVVGADNQVLTYGNKGKQEYCQKFMQGIITGEQAKECVTLSKTSVLTPTERSAAFLMTMFLIMATINGAMMIKDKKTGTFTRCLYAINSGSRYILGNVMFNFGLTLIQVSIALLLFGIIQRGTFIGFGLGICMAFFISLVATLYATGICMICNSEVQANIIATSLASILSIIGGTFVAVNNMPTVLQYASIISPIRWVIEIIRLF